MALTTPLDSEIAEETGMITDQPTQTTQLPPRAQAAAALARLLARNPHLATRDEVRFSIGRSGTIFGSADVDHPEAVTAIRELAAVLGMPVHTLRHADPSDESMRVSLSIYGDFDGAHWNCSAHVRADAYDFETFASDHNADPQEWTEQERAEYAVHAAGLAAAA